MPMRMRPPTISILFDEKPLILLPRVAPIKDNVKVIAPITIMGMAMEIFRKAKLKPTARASMLVATDRTKSVQKLRFISFPWFSGLAAS